jgi:hypothetical protein
MSRVGPVEVSRTYFFDEEYHQGVTPLDAKIGLIEIEEKYSRYTPGFGAMTAHLYAMMTEEEVVTTLKQLCGIDMETASLARLVQTVGQPYIPAPIDPGVAERCECQDDRPLGLVERRIIEIEAHADRDKIIQDAVEGKIEGKSSSNPSNASILYVSADGTGVPGLTRELSEKGKDGGRAKTFEAKVGVVFRQEIDESGLPILDKNGDIFRLASTTQYTATVEKVDQFAGQMASFVANNDIHDAPQVVFISDGALWLSYLPGRIVPQHIPVITIIDKYHAIEHLNNLVDKLAFYKPAPREMFREQALRLLDLGQIQQMVLMIRDKAVSLNPAKRESIEKGLEYFEKNAEKMRYGLFQAAGLFVGSGVVEAACKTVVGKRLKNAGMHWSKKGAAIAIALRCAILSHRFDYCRSELKLVA